MLIPEQPHRRRLSSTIRTATGALAGAELDAVPGIKKHTDKYDKDGGQSHYRARNPRTHHRLGRSGAGNAGTDGQTEARRPPAGRCHRLVRTRTLPWRGHSSGDWGHGRSGYDPRRHRRRVLARATARQTRGPTSTGGTFKIRVTHPTKTIPAKFNEQTTLGEEIAPDTVGSDVTVTLQSK